MYYLCFDIGGTMTKYGIIDDDYQIIFKSAYPTNSKNGGEYILNSVLEVTSKMLEEYKIVGVAISSAGVVDYINGKIKYANDIIPNYTGINFKEEIYNKFSLPCSLENDVNCFALSETIHYPNEDLLVLTVGTGIGGGIIINNHLFHGKDLTAGEFGQMIIDNNERFEKLCSLSSLVKHAQSLGMSVENAKDVFDLYDIKDEKATIEVERFYRYLALGLCNLAYCFNPTRIIIGGGISNRGEKFISELTAKIKEIGLKDYLGTTSFECCHSKNDGGLIGALVNYKMLNE